MNKRLRKYIMLAISGVRYVLCMLGVMWRFPIESSVGGGAFVLRVFFLCMLFFFRTFACIDMQYVSRKLMLLIVMTMFILSAILLGGDQLLMTWLAKLSESSGVGSVLTWNLLWAKRRIIVSGLLHGMLRYRRWEKCDALSNRRDLSLRSYVFDGSWSFTLISAFTIAAFVLVQFQQLPFSCEYLTQKSFVGVQAIENSIKRLGWGSDSVWVQDAAIIGTSWQRTTGQNETESAEEELKEPNLSKSAFLNTTWRARLSERKTTFVDQVMTDRQTVNEGICTYVIDRITEKYQDPSFQYSVAVLLMVLLTPFLTLLRITIYIINVMLLWWLQLIGVYRIEHTLHRVEEIV